ncbi:myb family transcription factor, partial [Metarhizium majus ARSEF 297]
MPKHHRNASGSHHYANQLSAAMATTPMYAQQPARIQVPANYYTIPPGPDSTPMQMPASQQEPYDAYAAEASALPPTQHRASSGAWSTIDDNRLVQARAQGLNWGQIKDAHFPTKSANACRKRHERLMERKGADDWDTRKFQQLAKEYMGMRKEIWSGLAARTGEKWNVVESKCMSNGLKNLQAAARQASRRERLETGSHITGYDDDSGISGIGLTPVDELDASYSSPETSSSIGATHSFSSNSATAYHLQGYAATHTHLHPVGGGGDQTSYGLGAYGASYGGHHEYSSSAGSSASMGHRYASRGNSPYMDTQRLSTADMGIDSLINRSAGR